MILWSSYRAIPIRIAACSLTLIRPSGGPIAQGKLIRIDARGAVLDPNAVPNAGQGVVLNVLGPIPLPLDIGGEKRTFEWYAFVRHTELQEANRIADSLRGRGEQHLFSVLSNNMSVNSVLMLGDFRGAENPLVRVHSCCLTGDVFGSARCECGPQLDHAFERIEAESAGTVIYMSGHEGRGIGLWAKAVTYVLRTAAKTPTRRIVRWACRTTVGISATRPPCCCICVATRPIRLLSNNPKKQADLHAGGLHHVQAEKHIIGVSATNRRYLNAKRGWGHTLDPQEIAGDDE